MSSTIKRPSEHFLPKIFLTHLRYHYSKLQSQTSLQSTTLKHSHKASKRNINMCIIKIRTHLCGERLYNNTKWPCAYENQADLLEISLESPGRLPVPLLLYEIGRLRALCEAQKTEEHFCNYYSSCVACVNTYARLGPAEVTRRLTPG